MNFVCVDIKVRYPQTKLVRYADRHTMEGPWKMTGAAVAL
jgi:hypothetical protein